MQSTPRLQQNDSIRKIAASEKQRIIDSVKRVHLEEELRVLIKKEDLQNKNAQNQLEAIKTMEIKNLAAKKARIDSLRPFTRGYPVVGVKQDTLFFIYSRIGASTAQDRARNVSSKIETLYQDYFFKKDSFSVVPSQYTYDIVYGKTIIMSISEDDALWHGTTAMALAEHLEKIIETSILSLKEERMISKILMRVALALLAIGAIWLVIWLLGKVHRWSLKRIETKKEIWLKNLNYKDYTFLSAEQELQVIFSILKLVRWFVLIFVLYLALPIVFSIFPISQHWADVLFHLIWSPIKTIFISIWHYLPNIFRILVIYLVIKYVVKVIRYVFREIENEKLQISGFHSDWAVPTFSIIKFLLYAFMFVLIFPLLPGSHSDIFKGVSVFIGILFSLGSSTAIANMVAGLVITYMRPFRIGDRIKIADVVGDVVEKSLLITRIRTTKNEIITIPNSSVLSGNTVNYSSEANGKGLILHTTVTIGYDVPWKDIHQALIDAALLTETILPEPQPFVLQTSLDDYYVAYQINAHTREASKQGHIYSQLHQNIQNVCNERGIEILSPHYRAQRDGNETTIPKDYRAKDYKSPSFNVNLEKDE
ncbi:mechanosensitive ion channel family protein [Gelidibacter sp.]|uniref:mechanosensitive ion channel family protein n=1 Tax=Gelidibacter sp. TaxID=2018083 RepID=UPI002C33CA14|nr:mechanosensitive ion channel family protein [Gelidibacter sp.]HUH28640.1 mechanosensitive ion channel family protein [Gelidibacter sp.]